MGIKSVSHTGELSRQCMEDSERWFGDVPASHSVVHHALSLAGEVGEFCNIVKKVDRGSLQFSDASTRVALAMELTDVYVYLLNLAGILDIDLEESYKIVRGQNETRFMPARAKREEVRHANGTRVVKDNPQA